jgi:hypothetical protein
MQVPHISVSESLLLRSPTASQGQGGALGEAEARKRGNTVGIRDQAMDIAKLQGHKVSREVANLPTPTASDWKNGRPGQGYGPNLPQTATDYCLRRLLEITKTG